MLGNQLKKESQKIRGWGLSVYNMYTNHINCMLYMLYTNHRNNLKSHNGFCYVHYVRPSRRPPDVQPPHNPAGFHHFTS